MTFGAISTTRASNAPNAIPPGTSDAERIGASFVDASSKGCLAGDSIPACETRGRGDAIGGAADLLEGLPEDDRFGLAARSELAGAAGRVVARSVPKPAGLSGLSTGLAPGLLARLEADMTDLSSEPFLRRLTWPSANRMLPLKRWSSPSHSESNNSGTAVEYPLK